MIRFIPVRILLGKVCRCPNEPIAPSVARCRTSGRRGADGLFIEELRSSGCSPLRDPQCVTCADMPSQHLELSRPTAPFTNCRTARPSQFRTPTAIRTPLPGFTVTWGALQRLDRALPRIANHVLPLPTESGGNSLSRSLRGNEILVNSERGSQGSNLESSVLETDALANLATAPSHWNFSQLRGNIEFGSSR